MCGGLRPGVSSVSSMRALGSCPPPTRTRKLKKLSFFRVESWFFGQNFQFFAPAAPIGTAGEYFHLTSAIFYRKVYNFVKKYQIFRARLRRTLLLPGKLASTPFKLPQKFFFGYATLTDKNFLALCPPHSKILATPLPGAGADFWPTLHNDAA